ncbi:MAG: dicarboxylate/amino acid:cation symporter [Bacteroidales bacterium]|nr:dicarboxylate/amino acid:cation symporter [Bacteroidales bacterium]
MNSIWKNYSSTILLIAFLIAGGVCGVVQPSVARFIGPIGDIFLNFLFAMVIPLVFFSVSVSFMKLKTGSGIGRTLGRIIFSFFVIWVVLSLFAYLSTLIVNPLGNDFTISSAGAERTDETWGETLVGTVSVSDFTLLFSKNHLLPLMIFSALLGAGVSLCGESGSAFGNFLEGGCTVISKATGILMKAAPIGLGCYFAKTVANTGSDLLEGYLRVFVIFWVLSLITVGLIFPATVRAMKGKGSLKKWWKAILPPSLTAMATTSSSVVIPGNIETAKAMGTDTAVAEATIPIATNLLKAGSVMGYVLKGVLLMSICGIPSVGIIQALTVTGISILSAAVIGAVAGGDVTGAVLTCTLLGVSPELAGIIIIIGTIIDIPATLVNSQSTVVATLITDNFKK